MANVEFDPMRWWLVMEDVFWCSKMLYFSPQKNLTIQGVCKYWSYVWAYLIFMHETFMEDLRVLPIVVLEVIIPALVNFRGIQQLTFLKPLLRTRYCVGNFPSWTHLSISGVFPSILETKRLRHREVRLPAQNPKAPEWWNQNLNPNLFDGKHF